MKEIEYMLNKLQDMLIKEEIIIDDNSLLEVVKVYDNLYAFMEEQHLTNIGKYRYQFVYSKNMSDDDETNFEIIKTLIELYKFKAFHLLDYPTLLFKLTGGMYQFNNMLNANTKLDLLLSTYATYLYTEFNDDEEMYIVDHFNSLSGIINNNYQDVIDSKFIDSNHKDIIVRYNEILKKYYNLYENDDYYLDSTFDSFIDLSYAYFVYNDMINNNYQDVMNFLDGVDNNILELNQKLMVSDIDTEEEFLNFIKSFYKSNKVLNKKQIK